MRVLSASQHPYVLVALECWLIALQAKPAWTDFCTVSALDSEILDLLDAASGLGVGDASACHHLEWQ